VIIYTYIKVTVTPVNNKIYINIFLFFGLNKYKDFYIYIYEYNTDQTLGGYIKQV
jgi:hypothetical protein